MSTELQTGLEIVRHLTTQRELAVLIAAASKRMLDLIEEDESDLIFTDELKKHIAKIEARHARGEGKTYTKEEFRKQLDNLMGS